MSAPIIISGTTGSGTRFVQFWGQMKIAGQTSNVCQAEMNLGHEFAPRLLTIAQECPSEWIDTVLATFARFRAGEAIKATHTAQWDWGKPTFVPIGESA